MDGCMTGCRSWSRGHVVLVGVKAVDVVANEWLVDRSAWSDKGYRIDVKDVQCTLYSIALGDNMFERTSNEKKVRLRYEKQVVIYSWSNDLTGSSGA
jgi:hypothetical protein